MDTYVGTSKKIRLRLEHQQDINACMEQKSFWMKHSSRCSVPQRSHDKKCKLVDRRKVYLSDILKLFYKWMHLSRVLLSHAEFPFFFPCFVWVWIFHQSACIDMMNLVKNRSGLAVFFQDDILPWEQWKREWYVNSI